MEPLEARKPRVKAQAAGGGRDLRRDSLRISRGRRPSSPEGQPKDKAQAAGGGRDLRRDSLRIRHKPRVAAGISTTPQLLSSQVKHKPRSAAEMSGEDRKFKVKVSFSLEGSTTTTPLLSSQV
ncbi:unnamed protein product [Nippostrongylus brasiliensis]|uniref:Uncharacterized protein n=1 Tax=Nippostrongylus brasiliensis TaxID=27835 RepID=A0A0N4XHU0_NIPBR|nr:unnamed protein product [Nippostrongylus brasiliensis]